MIYFQIIDYIESVRIYAWRLDDEFAIWQHDQARVFCFAAVMKDQLTSYLVILRFQRPQLRSQV